jgi:hypothetical protein
MKSHGGMKMPQKKLGVTSKFGVTSNQPSGVTFEPHNLAWEHLAGPSNTKRKADFGVMNDEPYGTTFCDPQNRPTPPFPIPHAADAKLETTKVINATAGQGTYSPDRKGPMDNPGSVGVGKSSPKKGRSMRTSQGW